MRLAFPHIALEIVASLLLQSDAGILPIGKSSALDPLRTTLVLPTPSLLNHILAVSYATSEKQVPHVNVAGYVHV